MKLAKKGVLFGVISALALSMAFPAAAEERETIEDITFYIESTLSVGESDSISSVSLELETEGCYIDEEDTKFLNEPDDGWAEDDKPRLKIVVRADEGYGFRSGMGKDDVYLDEDVAEVVSFSRTTSRATITVEFPPVGETEILQDEDFSLWIDDEGLAWDSSGSGMAYWDGTDYARYYEVRLLRNGKEVENSRKKTEDNHYDLSGYFVGEGHYTFEVRGIWSESETGDWAESESYFVTEGKAAEIRKESTVTPGAWIRNDAGIWWSRPDRTWPANQWEQINGSWYWFNEGGYRLENQWIHVGDKDYYLGAEGIMAANGRTPDGYWVGADGAWDGAPAV